MAAVRPEFRQDILVPDRPGIYLKISHTRAHGIPVSNYRFNVLTNARSPACFHREDRSSDVLQHGR